LLAQLGGHDRKHGDIGQIFFGLDGRVGNLEVAPTAWAAS
jgi:hypothetical protein